MGHRLPLDVHFVVLYVLVTNPIGSDCEVFNHVILKSDMLEPTDSTNGDYKTLLDELVTVTYPWMTTTFSCYQEWIETKHLWKDALDDLQFYFQSTYIWQRGFLKLFTAFV